MSFAKQVCGRTGETVAYTIAYTCARWCIMTKDDFMWNLVAPKVGKRAEGKKPRTCESGIYCATSAGPWPFRLK